MTRKKIRNKKPPVMSLLFFSLFIGYPL